MTSAAPGTTVSNFNRTYIVVSPTFPGPATFNLSVPDATSGGGGGGPIDISGVDPIIVDTQPDNGKVISIDITSLPSIS